MRVLVIHCSRQQVVSLIYLFAKIHLAGGNTIGHIPKWLSIMYKAAKTNDYRNFSGMNRMITHPFK